VEFFNGGGGPPPPPPPPPPPLPPPGQNSTSLALTTNPIPSVFEATVHVSGRLTDVNGAGIASARVDLEWSWDNVTWSPESQIGHFTTQSDGTYGADMCSMGRRRIRSTSGRSSRATRRTKLPRVPSSRS